MLHRLQDDRFDLVGVLLGIMRMDTHDKVVCHTIPGSFIVQGGVGQAVCIQPVSHVMGLRERPGELLTLSSLRMVVRSTHLQVLPQYLSFQA